MSQTNYIDTPNERITIKNGITYSYRELGEKKGIPIIALNHLSANLDNWDPVIINGLAKEHFIITFDYQGVGGTNGKVADSIQQIAIETIDFISALGFSKVHILGFSMGGMVAQEVIKLRPDLIDHMILAGTGPRGGKGIKNITKISDLALIRSLLTFKDIKRYLFFTGTLNGEQSSQDFLLRLKIRKKNRDKTINWFAYRRQLRAIKRWGEEGTIDLSTVNHPVLVVNGDHDIMVPTNPNTYLLDDSLSNSRLIIYPDSGHGSIVQNNYSFVNSANEFFKS